MPNIMGYVHISNVELAFLILGCVPTVAASKSANGARDPPVSRILEICALHCVQQRPMLELLW